MLEDYKADIDRYVVTQSGSWLYLVLTKQGLWALAEYRFSHWVRTKVQIPMIKQILKTVGFIWHKIIEIIAGIDIPATTQISKGFYIGHFGGIIINQDVKIGENCNISQGVTIGVGGRGENSGCPVIGDRVFIGPGAKIFGKIKIGNDVAIGANAVVTKDLPDQAVAVGIPAKIVSYKGSKDFILYRDSISKIESKNV
ncbi:Serine acetyltransferase [Planktothrix serta PCC 8927]|uniref:Serine acetyltransferase n=1 Tax=Planktothrix serta PCC 8927 TaxID=671068 RepID=A0A7Z9BF09_9CYAN|nr:serine O-acetyltransferase [Planktothrix serta]VXD11307.1 Serine acetyltransferase [Planktothrix serta PCC 8927]